MSDVQSFTADWLSMSTVQDGCITACQTHKYETYINPDKSQGFKPLLAGQDIDILIGLSLSLEGEVAYNKRATSPSIKDVKAVGRRGEYGGCKAWRFLGATLQACAPALRHKKAVCPPHQWQMLLEIFTAWRFRSSGLVLDRAIPFLKGLDIVQNIKVVELHQVGTGQAVDG